jgi:hypothetical protein
VGRDLFVGIGVDRYDTDLANLDHPVADVRAVAELFAGNFKGQPLVDAESAEVNDRLRSIKEQASGGTLVLMWSGHGSKDASGLRLATLDLVDEISAIEAARKARASQTLFIIDTCQAGTALDAVAMAGKLLDQSPPSGDPHATLELVDALLDGDPAQHRSGGGSSRPASRSRASGRGGIPGARPRPAITGRAE